MNSIFLVLLLFVVVYNLLSLTQTRTEDTGPIRRSPSKMSGFKQTLRRVDFRDRLSFNKVFLANPHYRQKLELLLLRSGLQHTLAPEQIIFFKQVAIFGIAGLLWLCDIKDTGLWIAGMALGYILPDMVIKNKIAARQLSIQRQLPGLIDLLALTMESGLDLMAALDRIEEKMKPGPLRDEIGVLLQESRLGTPRKESLKGLAHRTNLSDLQSLTSVIIQSEELGSSLAQVLRTFSEDMRTRRITRAEEIAGKAPVKIMIPMVVFFMPIIFVVIFGPVILDLMKQMK